MNFSFFLVASCCAFGIGYAVGQAESFNWWKLLAVLIFAFPLLSTGNDFYTKAVEISFFCGVLVSYGILHIGLLYGLFDNIINFKLWLIRIFSRKKESVQPNFNNFDRTQQEEPKQEQDNKFNDEDLKREQKRRADEFKRSRDGSNREKKRYNEESRKQQEQNSNYEYQEKIEKKVDNRTAYEILGVSEGFSKEELKRAYKRACSRCHSDKFPFLGEVAKREMDEEFKKVQGAYRYLK